MNGSRYIIVALDTADGDDMLRLADQLTGHVGWFKIGLEALMAFGPTIIDEIHERTQARVFVDGKFHDIPNTVTRALKAIIRPGVGMVNIHASGGREMMKAAVDIVHSRETVVTPMVLAVTVLTSLDERALEEVGQGSDAEAQVSRLALLAKECGCDGVVASPWEAPVIRQKFGIDFTVVTPGIRPQSAAARDQKRIATPGQARRLGADYLVVGRPITAAPDPAVAADQIADEYARAFE